jgi:hypothetical protein
MSTSTAPSVQPGSRTGQYVVLTQRRSRIVGKCTSDSVSWITVETEDGGKLCVDLEDWTLELHALPEWERELLTGPPSEGGAVEDTADHGSPWRLTDLDPRDELPPEYVSDQGDAVMVLYDRRADRLELRVEDSHLSPRDRSVAVSWWGRDDNCCFTEHVVRLTAKQATEAGQRLLDLAAVAAGRAT